METISYFVVWIDKDEKEKYSFIDIEVDKMDSAVDIHDKIYDTIMEIFETHFFTIKHVSFLKTNK